MRDDRERLRHMLEAMARVDRYAGRGEEAFRRDELIQTWMVRHIQIIGEAARALPGAFRDRYRHVPWADIVGMRHVIVHEYFGIDLDIVWRVVSVDLPALRQQIEAILRELDRST
ncbi:MAG: nucleotidyltransferase [Candidatus Rokubacteria bacterium GWC2_70_16]|nr:MAG: nucleotidyltransferase [Candidatus Rokubacteria bacterium GWC2_70_16]OGL18356.1 MAG: nucleotidyltransferase [Candidatus Rokubacteria bacterium RIFCSPLOWO2_12_FULL_71_19]